MKKKNAKSNGGKNENTQDGEPASRRKGGMKKKYKTFISFADEYVFKAALIQHAEERRVTFSVVGREMVSEFLKSHKIRIPTIEEAEKIVHEFSNNA